MMSYSILELRNQYSHRQLTVRRVVPGLTHRVIAKSYAAVSLLVMLVSLLVFGRAMASAQVESGGDKFIFAPESGSSSNTEANDNQSGQELSAGSLAIQAVQGTPGAPKIGAAEVEIEFIQDGQIIDHIDTQLDEFGVLVLHDLPIEGGIIPVVRVHYGEVKYQQPGVLMDAEHPQQRLRVTCYETTEDKPNWTIAVRHIMVTQDGGKVNVAELIVVNNPSAHTWLGDGSGEPGSSTRRTVVFSVPTDAKEVHLGSGFLGRASSVDPGVIASWLPLMPGKNEFKFEYHFHADAEGKVGLTIPQNVLADQLMVILPRSVQVDGSDGVTFAGEQSMGTGPAVEMYTASNLQPGQVVSMQLSGFTGEASAKSGAMVATTGPVIAKSSGIGAKLIAGIGAGLLLLVGIVLIFMKSPRGVVEGKKRR